MDKKVVAAAALSVLILIAWSYLFPPPKPPERPPVDPAATESIADNAPSRMAEAPPPTREVVPAEPVEEEAIQAARVEEIRIESDLVEVLLTNQGARALSWKLRDYTTRDARPLELLPQFAEGRPLMLGVDLDDPSLTEAFNEALYEVERLRLPAKDGLGSGESIRFSWADGRGLEATKTLTFRNGSYVVGVELDVRDRGRRLPARLLLGPGFGAQEPGDSRYFYANQGVWNQSGNITRMSEKKLATPAGGIVQGLRWAGLEDQYFAALIVPQEPQAQVAWRPVPLTPVVGAERAEEPVDHPLFSVTIPEAGAGLFVGPKKYTLLRTLGSELEKVVWFSSNGFLAWISRFIFLSLIWIHDHTIPNYGMAIVLSTFVLRVILFPVNQYSMVSMKKTQLQMQKLQPKIKAIRAKHKKAKDSQARAAMNQEMMAMYKQEGVNPMGGLTGCLPLLAQFPILIGFYNMLTVAVELRGAPFFGWIQDLSHKDPYWVIPLAMGITMFMQQKMAMSKVKDPVQQQQQRFMMFMPIIFTWICLQMPSGMVLYWFVNNVLGMGQQWLVNRQTSRLETAPQKA